MGANYSTSLGATRLEGAHGNWWVKVGYITNLAGYGKH